MRMLIFIVALVLAMAGVAEAAQPSWLGDLLGLPHSGAHTAEARKHGASKPKPATAPKPAPLSEKPSQQGAGKSSGEAPKAGDKPKVPLPRPRPTPPQPQAEPPAAAEQAGSEAAPAQSKPARVFQTACPAVVAGIIKARALPPISEGQCVARSPLGISAVMISGREIAVKGSAETDCAVATSLAPWLRAVDGYVFARLDTHLKAITVGGSYVCRDRRTGKPDDTLSEHAFADALDVTGFVLENGRTITVSDGWMPADGEDGRMLRFTHNAACSVFMTTLGPEANALHADHFHIDMGCHGKSCTYRMCE